MVDAVLSNTAGSGVCVVRPPGHHADEELPSGFCLLNNVAAAAAHAVRSHGLTRVLIVDWDVHHGNGTQRITYSDEKILYVSIHRYDHGAFFPHSRDADHAAAGAGRGEGFNVNVPWNKRGMGDVEYMAAFTQIVLPVAYEYNPQLVLVSAGFDACVGDPLGGCKVTPECYGRMTQFLRALAGGRVVLCLEGGYNVTSVAHAMTQCTKALLGDPLTHHYDPAPLVHPSAVETINNVISTHKKYWKSLKFQLALPIENVLEDPAPSRGLTVTEDQDISGDAKSEESFESKSSGKTNDSLEAMEMLSLKCADGEHCGTDDENPGCSKSKDKLKKPSSKDRLEAASSNCLSKSANLVDYLADNMGAIVNGDMFAVIPLPWCRHVEMVPMIPADVKFEQGAKCRDCEEQGEVWVCLHCYVRACGRSINAHMEAHYAESSHPLVLSLFDLSVWCYACDAYVDNPRLYAAKDNAHMCKFNEHMPYSYPSTTLHIE